MSNTRLLRLKGFLSERFTALAVEVFSEVENIVETCYEENKQLRRILHTVLSPEIKLHKIDVSQYTEQTGDIQRHEELNLRMDPEISETSIKIPKEEQIEYEVNWDTSQSSENNDSRVLDCVKNEPEHEENYITDSFNIQVMECNQNTSVTVSPHVMMSDEAGSSSSVIHKDLTSDSQKHKKTRPSVNWTDEDPGTELDDHQSEDAVPKQNKTALKQIGGKNVKSKLPEQKTLLQMPRRIIHKSFNIAVAEQESFILRLNEAFKDFPEDQKPLITKMGLTTNVEKVESLFGEVPKGSPLSYQCPLPSSQDYMPCDDSPPQPPLPLFSNVLEPVPDLPTLSATEKKHLDSIYVTWEEAHNLEQCTRGRKASVEQSQKMRLISRFKEISKLKPGRSHAEQLLFRIKKGKRRSKIFAGQDDWKQDVLREYCRHLCVNWYPCGLVVHPNAPWVGVIPDGVVYDPREKSSFGLVHTEYVDVKGFISCSFLNHQNDVIQLKKTHQYYWHIQAEIMVTGMTWCDLLVYSCEHILVQRIYRDETTIKEMRKKLDEFYFYYFLPQLD